MTVAASWQQDAGEKKELSAGLHRQTRQDKYSMLLKVYTTLAQGRSISAHVGRREVRVM
jgi:hypothetical protein